MFERILNFSIAQRWLVLMITIALAILGAINYGRLPIDAVPDITNIQVQINTEAPGYTPQEVESVVTFNVETALGGLPSLEYTRSLSRYGLSQVTVVFKDGTDIYFARQLISERLQEVRQKLPTNLVPTLGPITTGLGEIFMYTVENEDSQNQIYSPTELRTAQDWIVKPQLRTVPGVIEVNTIGGFEKQYHVQPNLDRMLSLGLTLKDLEAKIAANNANIGAGYTESNGEQYLVRVTGVVASASELEELVVSTIEGKPVFLKDVATVAIGHELRSGAATENGNEVVLGTVFMLMGENSRAVAAAAAEKLISINSSLPKGMVARSVYDRTNLVDRTIQTVKTNLFEGAVLVIVVLFVFLRNIPAALLTAAVIPLSMLMTITGMVNTKISANLMSLGALDFGLIVDGSVIIVENCIRRLSLAQKETGRLLTLKERLAIVFEATKEVRQATMFGELIIIIVYFPILALSGIEGKMFHPMAYTVILALISAFILSITFVPAGVAVFLRGRLSDGHGRIITVLQSVYLQALQFSLRRAYLIVLSAVGIFLLSLLTLFKIGSEFIPSLDEGDIALHALRIPGTSLSQAVGMQTALERKIRQLPEVLRTFTKIGTAEIANDPMPPSVADGFVILRPRSEWPDPKKSKEQVVAELETAVSEVPGNNYEFTQPIEMRFNELIAGVRSDVAVKVFGDDLNILLAQAENIAKVLKTQTGAADVKVEQLTGLPMLSVEIDRTKVARFGIDIADVQAVVQTAIQGVSVGKLLDGDRRFEIVIKLPAEVNSDIEAIKSLPIPLSEESSASSQVFVPAHIGDRLRSFIPLSSVANVKIVRGPNQISRENGKRRVVVSANVRGSDLGSFVEAADRVVRNQIKLPEGYWLEWGGQFEHLISARNKLNLVIPLASLLVLLLLYYSLGSGAHALIVFTGLPLALSGGLLALYLRGIPMSVSAAVGFIALSGVSVLNGLVMLSFISKLLESGKPLMEAIIEGSITRLRPVLMTALVASLGFLPMALATGAGAEVQRPLATVVIGGIFSSTLLTLLVLPALFWLIQGFKK